MDSFFILILKFYTLLIFLLFFGRAFVILFSKFFKLSNTDEIDIHGINIYVLYPLIGIFFVGNFLFLINFFLPIKNNLVYTIFLFLFINILEKINFKFLIKYLKYSSLLIFLLVSSYNVNFHYDAGLYHLNNQHWLRESNIVFGFSNIYGALGVSSIYEYVSSFLWIDKSFILLHLLNIIFIYTFYTFLAYSLFESKEKILNSASFFLILYSIFDNFGISGGRNGFISIQSAGKQDVPIAILFCVTSLLILVTIIRKNYIQEELFIYSTFSLLLFQLKVSGATIVFLYIIYLYYFFKNNKLNQLQNLKTVFMFFILFSLWIIKSVIHTGCIFFPSTTTCFSALSWVNKNYIKTVEEITVEYSFSYDFQRSFYTWFREYLEIFPNKIILFNFLISFCVLFLLKVIFFRNEKIFQHNWIIALNILFNFIFYLRFGPDSRYLMGLQMLIISTFGIYSIFRMRFNKYILFSLFMFSIISLPRMDSYKSFQIFLNPSIDLPIQEMDILHERLYPSDGDQCWINIDCSANKYFYQIDSSKYFKVVTLKDK